MLERNVRHLVILLFMTYGYVNCDSCVTYDFEAGYNETFTNENLMCDGLPKWNVNTYSSLGMEGPSANSTVFITPRDVISCVSTFVFDMEADGALEILVYVESASQRDQLVVLAHQMDENGNDVAVGTALLTPTTVNFRSGWQFMTISLFGDEKFKGYLSFLGSASEESIVIVDSFRYIPPSLSSDSCEVYDDLVPPTTETPQLPECFAFSFEQEFDVTFKRGQGLCSGFTSWTLKNYTDYDITSPNSNSEQFITPGEAISCVSSLSFFVEAGGSIEVNLFMASKSEYDQIGVLANQIVEGGNDALTGSAVVTPLQEDYVDGWRTLRFTLSGEGFYEGYISFLGLAGDNSTIIIDSFRYIPPTFTQKDCIIYEGGDIQLLPEIDGSECVTFNFEKNFDTEFDNNDQVCVDFSPWYLGNYYSLSIDNFSPNGSNFISPSERTSCVSSFTFAMKPGGTIEVNVYMKSVSTLDYMIVIVKKVVPNGQDTVAGLQLYYAANDNFVQGWNVLKVTVSDFNSFMGYITLIGSTSEDSIGLIDSLRYIPPNSDEQCDIY